MGQFGKQTSTTPPTELAMQPISSIEDPTSSSFLNQSSVNGYTQMQDFEPVYFNNANGISLTIGSRPGTQLSQSDSTQIGGHTDFHNLSNDAG